MIPVDVIILDKESCSKEIRNSRSFEILGVRGDHLSQGKSYMFYMNCVEKFACKDYQGGFFFEDTT